MRLAIIPIFGYSSTFTPVSLFLPVQYLARNMLFNRLSVHFAQGVKNFITGWWHVLLSLPSPFAITKAVKLASVAQSGARFGPSLNGSWWMAVLMTAARANFCKKRHGEFNLRFISEKDRGIYDASEQRHCAGAGALYPFLNSGDAFHDDAALFVRQLARQKARRCIYIGDALLDFGGGHKIRRKAKPGYYIYHSLPASHQRYFPTVALKVSL